eukprot:287043-Pelagomonas_calceolata.AAC.3
MLAAEYNREQDNCRPALIKSCLHLFRTGSMCQWWCWVAEGTRCATWHDVGPMRLGGCSGLTCQTSECTCSQRWASGLHLPDHTWSGANARAGPGPDQSLPTVYNIWSGHLLLSCRLLAVASLSG